MPTFEKDVDLAVSASRLWKCLVDGNTLLPQIAPIFIASIDVIEGGVGEVGEVTLVKLGPIAPDGAFVKEKRVEINHETMTMASEELAGGHLAVGFSKWVVKLRLEPINADKVKLCCTVDYEVEGDSDVSVAITQAKEGLPMLFQCVEEYIVITS